MMLNNDYFLSEAMSQGIASPGVPTDPSRVKELLEEMNKLYDIDLLPLRKCILGVHLIAEFGEQAMLQDENGTQSPLFVYVRHGQTQRRTLYQQTLYLWMTSSVTKIRTRGTPNMNFY